MRNTFGDIDWTSVVTLAISGVLFGIAMANIDRFHQFTGLLRVLGALFLTFVIVVVFVIQPLLAIALFGFLVIVNLLHAFVAMSAKLRAKPARGSLLVIWANETQLLEGPSGTKDM